jgi:hypothetical protein
MRQRTGPGGLPRPAVAARDRTARVRDHHMIGAIVWSVWNFRSCSWIPWYEAIMARRWHKLPVPARKPDRRTALASPAKKRARVNTAGRPAALQQGGSGHSQPYAVSAPRGQGSVHSWNTRARGRLAKFGCGVGRRTETKISAVQARWSSGTISRFFGSRRGPETFLCGRRFLGESDRAGQLRRQVSLQSYISMSKWINCND